jgi:hypothetical protein
MVLGKWFFGEGADAAEGPVNSLSEFMSMMEELMLLNGVLNIGDWIPWLDWLGLQGYVRRMKKLGKMFDALMEYVLDEHSERRRRREDENFVARDMVDVLMQLADDPTLEVQLGQPRRREGIHAGHHSRRHGEVVAYLGVGHVGDAEEAVLAVAAEALDRRRRPRPMVLEFWAAQGPFVGCWLFHTLFPKSKRKLRLCVEVVRDFSPILFIYMEPNQFIIEAL